MKIKRILTGCGFIYENSIKFQISTHTRGNADAVIYSCYMLGETAGNSLNKRPEKRTKDFTERHELITKTKKDSYQNRLDDSDEYGGDRKREEKHAILKRESDDHDGFESMNGNLNGSKDHSGIEAAVRSGEGLFVLMDPGAYTDIDYTRLADRMIKNGEIENVATYLYRFQPRSLHPSIAEELVKAGYAEEIKNFPGIFNCSRDELNHICDLYEPSDL